MELIDSYLLIFLLYAVIGIIIIILFILACRDFVVIRRNTAKTQKLIHALLKWQIEHDKSEWEKLKEQTRRDMDISAFLEEKSEK